MAKRTAGRSKKNEERRSNASSQRSEMARGREIPESLVNAIENERGTLAKAQSILRCLTISLESEASRFDGPYYPDIAELASELLRQAFNGLDIVNLEKQCRYSIAEDSASIQA